MYILINSLINYSYHDNYIHYIKTLVITFRHKEEEKKE
jgi:hypothetical protein